MHSGVSLSQNSSGIAKGGPGRPQVVTMLVVTMDTSHFSSVILKESKEEGTLMLCIQYLHNNNIHIHSLFLTIH